VGAAHESKTQDGDSHQISNSIIPEATVRLIGLVCSQERGEILPMDPKFQVRTWGAPAFSNSGEIGSSQLHEIAGM
jgi:hypothetical protein